MRRAAVLLVLALPLALAACGGAGGKSSSSTPTVTPVASMQAAAKKTAASPSEHMSVKGSVTVAGQSFLVSGNGDFDNTNRGGVLHLDFSAGAIAGTIDEVLSGTTIYLKSPLLAASLPQGKTWFKLDLRKALASRGIDLSTLGAQHPAETLAQLQAVENVKTVGDETVDGTATTHYRARVDLSKLPQGRKLKALAKARYGPYDVWVGKDDGYVHRIRLSFSTGSATARQVVALTLSFSDFGKKVTVTMPPAAQVVDATSTMIQGLGG
jgi:hypothetical protein